MKANELRIGNLIYEKNNMYENAYFEVIEVDLIHLKEIKDDLRDYIVQEPIPLTEEWLLKFGFKRLGKDTFYLRTVKIHHRKRGFVLARRYADIKHVHQLQNLYFALIGEELKIK